MISRLLPTVALVSGLLLVGCARQTTPTPIVAPTPTAEGRASMGAVRASANIVPTQKAELSFPASGRVQTIAVREGDQVEAGAVLISLDKAVAEAAAEAAQATLNRAQAHLSELKTGPRPQEVEAAQARLAAAQAQQAQLSEGARPDEIAAARAELAAAQAALQALYNGPRPSDEIDAAAALSNAEAALRQAQAAYDRVASRNDLGMLPESRQLQEATNNYAAAKAHYDALHAAPDPDVVAAARARVQQARAALDRSLNPASKSQLAEAEAQVHGAQAELDLLKAGARPETIAAAVADVAQAQAALQQAMTDVANTDLRAPFAGTVTSLKVNPGEMVLPAQPVLTLADLSRLRAETTDFSERDVARVAVGQEVVVYVQALNTELKGRVTAISPQANIVAGDVVYTIIIDLEAQPPGLRWGMSVEVDVPAE